MTSLNRRVPRVDNYFVTRRYRTRSFVANHSPDRALRYLEVHDVLDRFAGDGAVLELGSGPDGLRDQRPSAFVVTVDLHIFPSLDVQADGCHLPFRDGAFATAVCIDVLEHVPPALRTALIDELLRVTSGLLVIGGPMGTTAEHADRTLERWFHRTGRPVPDWLNEHVATGPYPTADEVNRMVGRAPLWSGTGVGVTAHRVMSAAGGVRGGTALGRAITCTPEGQGLLARVAGMGAPYRVVLAYDMRPVTFSVVMATRNRAERLPAAVDSVLAQTDPDFELIIVNDASTDATAWVASSLRRRDARIRVIDVPSATGSCGLARNVGLRAAKGRYLAFCDDDVQWHPGHLATCAAALERSDACYTTAARFLPDGRYYDLAGRAWGAGGPEVGDLDANTIAVRREVMQPFPDGRGRYESEDIRLAIALFRRGVRFQFVPEVTVDYTFNPASHCYSYTVEQRDGEVVLTSRPKVADWRAARGRVLEAGKVRLRRLAQRVRGATSKSPRAFSSVMSGRRSEPYDAGRDATDDGSVRHVVGHHRVRPDHGVPADRDAREHDGAATQPASWPEEHGFAVGHALKHRRDVWVLERVLVVGDVHAIADQHVGLDDDRRSSVDVAEPPHIGVVADREGLMVLRGRLAVDPQVLPHSDAVPDGDRLRVVEGAGKPDLEAVTARPQTRRLDEGVQLRRHGGGPLPGDGQLRRDPGHGTISRRPVKSIRWSISGRSSFARYSSTARLAPCQVP